MNVICEKLLSFPSRERGLKVSVCYRVRSAADPRRSPHGNVDWNPNELQNAFGMMPLLCGNLYKNATVFDFILYIYNCIVFRREIEIIKV